MRPGERESEPTLETFQPSIKEMLSVGVRQVMDWTALAGRAFGMDYAGVVWIGADLSGREHPEVFAVLEAHAEGFKAIEGSRKRLPAHRLKVCDACGSPALVVPAQKRCRCCRAGKLEEIRMIWTGVEN